METYTTYMHMVGVACNGERSTQGTVRVGHQAKYDPHHQSHIFLARDMAIFLVGMRPDSSGVEIPRFN